jgi:hypothetical protein
VRSVPGPGPESSARGQVTSHQHGTGVRLGG